MYEQVPNELKQYPNWVCWKAEEEPSGRISKKPINPITGGYAQSNNSKTWSSFQTALKESVKYNGIGFMFSESPFFGIDLDHMDMFIEDYKGGGTNNVISEFIHTLGSYAEYSVSGKGIHILCKGTLPPEGRRKGNFEFYQDGRFFTVTGNAASEYTEIEDCTERVKPLHEKYIGGGTAPTTGISLPLPLNLTESEIIKLAEASKQGPTFRALYSGQYETIYDSQSEADLALCNMLAFWCGKDEQLMDKMFRNSGLMREKWDRKQSGSTYGELTIRKAARSCAKVYEPTPEYSITISQSLVKPKPDRLHSFDDTGNASRFIDLFGHKVRYNFASNSWMYYDGRKWSFDETGATKRMTDELIVEMKNELERWISICKTDDEVKEMEKNFAKHLKTSRSSYSKTSMLKESQHIVPVMPNQLDAHKMLLCTPNGVVNLCTGDLQDHNPDDFITKITNCEYTDKTDYPLWEKFLNEIFAGDKELIKYMQKAVGYSLTGSTKEQCAFFCFGTGNNGKSTFLETICDAIGDYAMNIQPESLMTKKFSTGGSSDIARLKGARFVNSSEPEQGVKLNESLVKQLTGSSVITARKLYENEIEYTPEFKLWMSMNYKPVIRGTDLGIWRRVRLIPFTTTIPDEKIDRNLKYKLRQELSGIFKWAVEGALLWQREGLKTPQVIAEATKEYKNEMDVISSFLEACCEVGSGEERGKDLYQAFATWARENNEYEMSSRKFGTEIVKKFDNRKSNGERVYLKVRLINAYKEQDNYNDFTGRRTYQPNYNY